MSKSRLTTLGLVFASGWLLAGCQTQPAAQLDQSSTPTTATAAPNSATPEALVPTLVVAPTSKVASVETSYQSPAAEEKVAFTVVVDANGIITDAQTEVKAKNPTSVMRQTSFAKDFPAALKGKKLSELTKIDRVGGSSLTTGAFNKALDQLKASIKS